MIYRIYNKQKLLNNIIISITTDGIEVPNAESIILEKGPEGSFIITSENGEQVQFEKRGVMPKTFQSATSTIINHNLELIIDEKLPNY